MQYLVLRTVQSALHFTSLTDLFTQTPSRLLWEAASHMLQLMREGYSYSYTPLFIARYSFIQLSELEQRRVNKPAQGFNTAAQDSNSGSRSRESEALPLSRCESRLRHPQRQRLTLCDVSWQMCSPLLTGIGASVPLATLIKRISLGKEATPTLAYDCPGEVQEPTEYRYCCLKVCVTLGNIPVA